MFFVICGCLEGSKYDPEKVKSPMLVTEFGIVMEVKPVQFLKALSPMLVTE